MDLNYLWESFHSAAYLLNRLPSPILNHKSPFELVHGFKPDYNLIKVFECACYPCLKPNQCHKLSFKTTKWYWCFTPYDASTLPEMWPLTSITPFLIPPCLLMLHLSLKTLLLNLLLLSFLVPYTLVPHLCLSLPLSLVLPLIWLFHLLISFPLRLFLHLQRI